MARILYVAKLAVDRNGMPLVGVRGVAGTIIKRGTPSANPVITEDEAGTLVIPGSALTVTEQGFVPSFWVDELDMPVSWWDGAIEVPLETTEGLSLRVEDAVAEAEAAKVAAEAAAQSAENAANLVDTPTDTAMAALVADGGSQTGAAVEAKVAPIRPGNGARAVGRGELVINVKDYGALGDGTTDDTAAINAAIAAVPTGGVLYFPRGRYMTNGGHVITTPSIRIQGASGRAQTYNSSSQLYLRAGANADMLTISANQVTVRDLSLYGNWNNQTGVSRGIVFPNTAASNYFLLDAVWVDSFNGDGYSFDSSGGTLSGTVTKCEARVNQGYGMKFLGGSTDTMVSDCYIDQNRQSGVHIAAGDISLTSCHIWGNGTTTTGDLDGITLQSAGGCRIVNCYIETNTNGAGIRFKTGANRGHIVSGCDIWSNGYQGIYAFQATNCAFTGNIIRTNNYKGATGASGSGITLDSCTAIATTGNNFFSIGLNRQRYGYYENGTANAACVFMGNVSRASEHSTGNWVIGAGASPTIPATPASFNVG